MLGSEYYVTVFLGLKVLVFYFAVTTCFEMSIYYLKLKINVKQEYLYCVNIIFFSEVVISPEMLKFFVLFIAIWNKRKQTLKSWENYKSENLVTHCLSDKLNTGCL